jgi:hypothetical protein
MQIIGDDHSGELLSAVGPRPIFNIGNSGSNIGFICQSGNRLGGLVNRKHHMTTANKITAMSTAAAGNI